MSQKDTVLRNSNKTEKKKFLSKIPSGVSLYKKIFACYQYIYYVLFQLMLWLHYGVIWSIRISKKRERNNWNKTFWGSSAQFSERIIQHPNHQIDLVLLVKPGTTHMHSRKTAWRAWEWLIVPPRLEQTAPKQHEKLSTSPSLTWPLPASCRVPRS